MTVSRDEFDQLVERVHALEDSEARTSQRLVAVVLDAIERVDQHLDRHDEQFEQIQRRLDQVDQRFDRLDGGAFGTDT